MKALPDCEGCERGMSPGHVDPWCTRAGFVTSHAPVIGRVGNRWCDQCGFRVSVHVAKTPVALFGEQEEKR